MKDDRPDPASREIDIMRVMRLLPHRYPFLMVDRIVDVVPGTSATGIKNVSINEPHFQGHFPQKPVVPGDVLHIHVHIRRRRGNVWKFDGQAKVDGVLVAEATYSAMIMDE